ncbi:MAG: MBL fold metallo-hydrolase [Faecousia sp.]
MSMKSDYEAYLAKQDALRQNPMAKAIWLEPTSRYVHPFRLYGNVWYVGDAWVCAHLIDTGDGLLLIDTGNIGATALLIQSIWEAGFNPKDVKWIIESHGHLDHIGGAVFFQKMFGSKVYLGEPDARMFRERPELAFLQDSPSYTDSLFVPDYEIHDGDVLTFGNTTVSFALCPGHTDGVIACFFDARDGDQTRRCGYYGGFGFNTLLKDYLIEIGDPEFKTRQIYLNSLAKVRNEKVDIFLGNHCNNNNTMERRKKQEENPTGPNPFVDENAWGVYLDQKREELLKFMEDPKNN